MKKFTKRKLGQLGLALGIACSIYGSPLIIDASDDNDNDYQYHIASYTINTSGEYAYRQTDSVNNPWKVRMDWSWEGEDDNVLKTTITRFWLEDDDDRDVSVPVNKLEGDPFSYIKPNSSANKKRVWLTADNNNYNLDQYICHGYWDEETW
jgi:hypothetical protein